MTDDVDSAEGGRDPIRPLGEGNPEVVDRLAHLAELHASGALSDDEFDAAKRAALGATSTSEAKRSSSLRGRGRWIAAGAVALAGVAIVAALVVTSSGDAETISVEGTFVISNGSYDASNEFDDPNFTDDGAGGCQGDSGYGDLNSITQVVVTDDDGSEVARTELGSGEEMTDSCVFTFFFDVEEGAEYYVVSIGDRGSSQYTYDELSEPGAVSLVIGDD